jgi:UDP-glucose 4-epimerase
VYGSNPRLPKVEDELVPMPMSPYAASKLATESYALAHAASFGLDVLAFRFFNVFGPLQPAGHAYAAVVPAFVDAVDRRVSCERPVNLAFGSRVSLLELATLLGEVLGTELAMEFGPPRTGDVRDTQADQTRLRSLFPDVEPVELEAGLRATIDWFRASATA